MIIAACAPFSAFRLQKPERFLPITTSSLFDTKKYPFLPEELYIECHKIPPPGDKHADRFLMFQYLYYEDDVDEGEDEHRKSKLKTFIDLALHRVTIDKPWTCDTQHILELEPTGRRDYETDSLFPVYDVKQHKVYIVRTRHMIRYPLQA